MLFLTNAGTAQGDPVALLMVLALAALVAVLAVRKLMLRKHGAKTQIVAGPAAPAAAPAATQVAPAPGTAGKLKLHDVEPKTAAMLMAITADKLGKPLNELRFVSIKEVKK